MEEVSGGIVSDPNSIPYLTEQYRMLHGKKPGYGKTGESLVPVVEPIVRRIKPGSILDYGSGKSDLVNLIAPEIEMERHKYDPAIMGLDTIRKDRYGFLMSTDVLEHFPEDLLSEILSDMKSLSPRGFHAISTRESGNVLPDGRKCHLCVKDHDWWMDLLEQYFKVVKFVKYFSGPQKICLEVES